MRRLGSLWAEARRAYWPLFVVMRWMSLMVPVLGTVMDWMVPTFQVLRRGW